MFTEEFIQFQIQSKKDLKENRDAFFTDLKTSLHHNSYLFAKELQSALTPIELKLSQIQSLL